MAALRYISIVLQLYIYIYVYIQCVPIKVITLNFWLW